MCFNFIWKIEKLILKFLFVVCFYFFLMLNWEVENICYGLLIVVYVYYVISMVVFVGLLVFVDWINNIW